MERKYIFVTGGVSSSLGKGIAVSSLGALLEARGLKVSLQKIDPYLNVDPGTMSPYEHGEVYVTDDGAETDLDLGNYERFTSVAVKRINSVTAGTIYKTVIDRERKGDYLGKTVQVIPHVTNEIKAKILGAAEEAKADVAIIEIGGTVGDIESVPFLEAARQLARDLKRENVMYLHLTLVPMLSSAGEMKTKPTQHSVKMLREDGIQPDVILCRCASKLDPDLKAKIALFCDVDNSAVISALDAASIYEIPLRYHEEGLDDYVIFKLNLYAKSPNLTKWQRIEQAIKNPIGEVNIAVVGKYIAHQDAYKSIYEALAHGGLHNRVRVNFIKIDSEDDLENSDDAQLQKIFEGVDGILVPGGFGDRGIRGKIRAAEYAREKNIPYFGICLGMQVLVIEFARNALGYKTANSTEFDQKTEYPVIDLMEEQKGVKEMGGSMRLGAQIATLSKTGIAARVYKKKEASERHRHRFEFNNAYREAMEQKGLFIGGMNRDFDLVEIVEIPEKRWHLGVQFHPEFQSKPFAAHPLFADFIRAAFELHTEKMKTKGKPKSPVKKKTAALK